MHTELHAPVHDFGLAYHFHKGTTYLIVVTICSLEAVIIVVESVRAATAEGITYTGGSYPTGLIPIRYTFTIKRIYRACCIAGKEYVGTAL